MYTEKRGGRRIKGERQKKGMGLRTEQKKEDVEVHKGGK